MLSQKIASGCSNLPRVYDDVTLVTILATGIPWPYIHPLDPTLPSLPQPPSSLSYFTLTQELNWGDPTGSQIQHLLFEIHYL